MTKKRGLNIHVHFTNRWLYTLIAIGILAVIGIGVYALTPGVAPNPGHLISELAPPSPCTANQSLQFDGTNWKCVTPITQIVPTGLYGTCAEVASSGACTGFYGPVLAPAYCGQGSRGNKCNCPSEYTTVVTGIDRTSYSGINWLSCYKN